MPALRCEFRQFMAILVLKNIKEKNGEDLKFCRKLGTYKSLTSKINSTLGVNFD